MRRGRGVLFGVLCWAAVIPSPAFGQTEEAAIVDMAAGVLNEIMAVPVTGIPYALLADAEGIAIVPNTVKAGFVVGVRHGRGVLVVRDEARRWQPPTFVSLTGGSIGWQAGVQASDLVLVFKTRSSVAGVLRGKFTIGADASASAGPVGREASAATDATLSAEIYSYSRSRGLFAGAAIDGSVLQIDGRANVAYYGTPLAPIGPPTALPPSATRLLQQVARYTTPGVDAWAGGEPGAMVSAAARPDADAVRRQLADAARRLSALLDPNWQTFLALPTEIYAGDRPARAEAVTQSLSRFETVAKNPQYRSLAERPEFKATYDLLRQYSGLLVQPPAAPLSLPPPPTGR
jgi:SH3 domain-containing YSC84-like protein 1